MLISHISASPLFKILQRFLVVLRVKPPMFLMADMALHDMSPTTSLTSSPYRLPLVPSQAYSKLGTCNVCSLSLKVCHVANPLISFLFLLKLSPQQGLLIHSILNLSCPPISPQNSWFPLPRYYFVFHNTCHLLTYHATNSFIKWITYYLSPLPRRVRIVVLFTNILQVLNTVSGI